MSSGAERTGKASLARAKQNPSGQKKNLALSTGEIPTGRMVIPTEWSFDSPEVVRAFDAHVREQLPWYELATGIVCHVARHYVPRDGLIVDVGCSTGNVGRALRDLIADREASLVGIDRARIMAQAYDAPGVFQATSAENYEFGVRRNDLIVCFLSLMFVPVHERLDLVARMHMSLRPGGALVVFDKTEPRPGYIGVIAHRLALAAKSENGAPAAEVIAKELSLAGVQRPLSDRELAGFVEIFRFGDFAGFVMEKVP
jgi:tRNA (cmo5U34)-methyltransferase